MSPKAPAIVVYQPDSIVWLAWTDADLFWHIESLQKGNSLEVMDEEGSIFDIRVDLDGTTNTQWKRNDAEAIRRMLLALAGGESRFDPSELNSAHNPQEMFTAYAHQI
jgi:hypothetical protein